MVALRKFRRFLFPITVLVAPAVLISALAQDNEGLVMNFRNVDIRQIIESVGEVTGKNFLIDPRVRSKVTIIANEPVPQSALYDVLLSILRMHGFRAVENIGITRIIPANLGGRYAANNVAEGLVTEIISIQYLNSASIIPLIKPLMTPQAQVLNHKETNKLIISETQANLERAKTVLAKLDTPSIANYDIISLNHLDAANMQKVLQRVSNKNLRHLVEIVADKDANRIILTGPDELRLRLRLLIADMDTPAAAAGLSGTIQIISLRYAKAEDMAALLKNLFSSSGFLKNLGGQGSYAFTKKAAKPVKGKKKPAKKPTPKKGRASDARNYTIQYDKETNSLIVGGPPKIIEAAQYIISKLDVPRPQVLIEAIIADISADQMEDFNSVLRRQAVNDAGIAIQSDNDERAIIKKDSYKGVVSALSGGRITLGGFVASGSSNFSFMIDALNSDANTNILSTPSILTLNNEEASIDVADTRYVQTGSTSNSGGTTASRNKEEFGTLLKVTPQITEGDAVKLELEQKTEDIVGETIEGAGNDRRTFPTTRKREIKTSVLVNDGDILVLGGLIKNTRKENKNKIPLLGDIPFLGKLFRDQSSGNAGSTLMIFIRPTILRNPQESFDLSKEVYANIRYQQLLYGTEIDSILDKEDIKDSAILPEINGEQANDKKMQNKHHKEMESSAKTTEVMPELKPSPKQKIIRRVIRRRVVEKGA